MTVLRDSDRDGAPDMSDGCPKDGAKTSPDICGCGNAELDLNSNGVIDCVTTEELKDLIGQATGVLKKLKLLRLSGDRQKDKKKKKKQKAIKDELKALLDEIISTVLSPVQPIVLVNSGFDLLGEAEKARRLGRKATRTAAKNFKKNKAKARRALKNLQEVLA